MKKITKRIFKKRTKSGHRTITLSDPILKQLEKLWYKSGIDDVEFNYWFRRWIKEQLNNE